MAFNSAWSQILLFVGICLIVNIVSWYFRMWNTKGMEYSKYGHNKLLPPGFLIGLIWPVIFGFFGYAHYLTYSANKSKEHPNGNHSVASVSIIVYAVYCLLYPFLVNNYAPGFEHRARILNFFALIFAFIVGILVLQKSQTAFYYIIPVIVWTGYVNLADYIYINQNF